MKITTLLFLLFFALTGAVVAASATRMTAELRGDAGATGKASYSLDGSHARMSVFLENVNARKVKIVVGGQPYTIPVANDGSARLFLDSQAGDRIPRLKDGDEMRIFSEERMLLSGRFRLEG